MSVKMLVPTIVDYPRDADHRVTVETYIPTEPIPERHRDAEVLVAWGNDAATLADAARLPRLRWVQALGAGAEAILSAGFREDIVITNGSGVHDRTVAEHAVALGLTLLRRMPAAAAAQREHSWSRELGGVQPLRPEGAVTSFIGARVLIWGFGHIGQHLATVLTTLGAQVRGVARSDGERAGFDVVSDKRIMDELPATDVLVMILPATSETRHALNAERLAALPPHAYVVNVGRGSTVDEDALIRALSSGSIAGAGIDVASVEPLPASSPLWDAPNLVITPHAAGGRPDRAAELISANLDAFLEDRPLRNVVARG